jgi:hypothetical protein
MRAAFGEWPVGEFPGIDAINRGMQGDQHRQRDHENDPAFQAMKESVGQLRVEFAQNARDRDPA